MPKRKPAQKPRMKKDGTAEEIIYLRIVKTISDAVEQHRRRKGMATGAEAIRDLLRRALEAEGLL